MQLLAKLTGVRGFLLARLFAKLGDNFLRFCLPLLAYQTTQSVTLAAVAFICQWLPRILFLPFGGVMVDRLGSQRSYLAFESARALCLLAGATASRFGLAPDFAIVCVVSAVTSVSGAVVFMALEKAIVDRVQADARGAAQSVIQIIEQGTVVAAPAVGGVVAHLGSGATALFLAAGLFVASVAVAAWEGLRHRPAVVSAPAARGRWSADIVDGWTMVGRTPGLRQMVVFTALLNLVCGVMMATLAPIATGSLGLSSLQLGLFTGLAGAATIVAVAAVPLLVSDAGMPRLYTGSLVVTAVAGALCGVIDHACLFFVLYATLQAGAAAFALAMRTVRARLVPKERLGRCLSVMMLLNQAPIPLAGVIVSSTAAVATPQTVVLGVSVLALAVAWLTSRQRNLLKTPRGEPHDHAHRHGNDDDSAGQGRHPDAARSSLRLG